MISFTKLFFDVLKQDLNEEEKSQLNSELETLYEGAVVDYKEEGDFEICKAQLLRLLTHIHSLSPAKLALFARYREKVAALSPEMAETDIRITLNTTKKSLERSLLSVRKNYAQVDKEKLDSLIVHLCYSGAHSNIDYALGYFQCDTLAFFVDTIKSSLLLELTQQFLLWNSLVPYEGNEQHDANKLYNYFATWYGLGVREDPSVTTEFADQVFADFFQFLEQHFTATALVRLSGLFIPPPPNKEITIHNNLYKELEDFFAIFRKKAAIDTKHSLLYDKSEDEDFNPILRPKKEFELFTSCLLAHYLQKKGYVKDAYFQALNQTFLSNGETTVKVATDGQYQLLSDEELLKLIQEPELTSRSSSLLQQLQAGTLRTLYCDELDEANKARYFSALLAKPGLAAEILEFLYYDLKIQEDKATEKAQLADYIFSNEYELSLELLDTLAPLVSENRRMFYLRKAIKNDCDNYVRSLLLLQHPLLSSEEQNELLLLAVDSGAIRVFTFFSKQKFNLDVTFANGLTIAHKAAIAGHGEIIQKLHELGIALNIPDNVGRTPAHWAEMEERVDVIQKLHDLRIIVDTPDIEGRTLAHWAAIAGHTKVIQKFHDLGISLDKPDNKGRTLAYYAAIHGQSNVIQKLHDFRIALDTLDKYGYAPIHYAVANKQVGVIEKLYKLGVAFNKGPCLLKLIKDNKDSQLLNELKTLGIIISPQKKQPNLFSLFTDKKPTRDTNTNSNSNNSRCNIS